MNEPYITELLKPGHGAGAAASGSMIEVEDSAEYLTDDDARAMAHYLNSLPA